MELTKEHVLRFLGENRLMAIATYGEFPWIATVYYGFDDDLTLYFLGDTSTLHVQQFLKNNKVAVAIADSSQEPESKKRGLQLSGVAEQLSDKDEIERALAFWKKNVRAGDSSLTYENFKNSTYKVIPKRIKLFDQSLFDVEDGKEPILEL